LLMSDLKAIAEELGLGTPKTFIASGNLLFTSDRVEAELSALLGTAIGKHMDAKVPVMIRTASEMAQVVTANPFADAPGSKVAAFFLAKAPPESALTSVSGADDEQLALGTREIYVAYPRGMGRSKLRIPAAAEGTARNINSVARMAALLKEME
jgi:uncharacterized protein (DUF1697 family)